MWTSPLLAYLVSGCIAALPPCAGIIPPRRSARKPRPAARRRGRRGRAASGGAAGLKLRHAQRVFVSHISTLTLRANPQAPLAARDTPVEARNGAFVDEGLPFM